MNKKGIWSLSPAYDITYSKGMATQHSTTIAGKSKDFKMDDGERLNALFKSAKDNIIDGINKYSKDS